MLRVMVREALFLFGIAGFRFREGMPLFRFFGA